MSIRSGLALVLVGIVASAVMSWCELANGDTDDANLQVRPGTTRVLRTDLVTAESVVARYQRLDKLLTAEAKSKLNVASKLFQMRLIRSRFPTDPERLARTQVRTQFAGLAQKQEDVLVFYLLADVLDHASISGRLKVAKKRVDGAKRLSETTPLRIQIATERRLKYMQTLSNVLKKLRATSDSVIQNIK